MRDVLYDLIIFGLLVIVMLFSYSTWTMNNSYEETLKKLNAKVDSAYDDMTAAIERSDKFYDAQANILREVKLSKDRTILLENKAQANVYLNQLKLDMCNKFLKVIAPGK